MTHFAPVTPIHGLRQLADNHLAGSYQLLIAPIVLSQDWSYARFFQEQPDHQIIMDNGLIELGHPLSGELLAKAAKLVGANVVVMPDTIDDGPYTAKQVRRGIGEYRAVDRATDTLGVVQGKTFEECMECAKQLVAAGVDWLGVPRGLTPNLGSRVPLVLQLAEEFKLPMHVLGFSDSLADDILAAAAHPLAKGIDSAVPMWTREWLPLHPPLDVAGSLSLGKRPKGFWTEAVSDRAGHNVETVRRWLNDATNARTAREELALQQGQSTAL